jgi:hypothetical protein
MENQTFKWVPLFQELAKNLLKFENNQKELIGFLEGIGVEAGLIDQNPKGNDIPMTEIDPFTFFSLILKYGDARKCELFNKLKNYIHLDNPAPETYEGVPDSNAQSAWLFRYKFDRSENDIKDLWKIFELSLINEITEESFENALAIKLVGIPKLTQGLFWTSPDKYFPINKQTKPYLKKLGLSDDPKDLKEYLKVCNDLLSTGTPLYKHSYQARIKGNVDVDDLGEEEIKIWAIALGEGGRLWNESFEQGLISIGWDDLGDLSQYESKEAISLRLTELRGDVGRVRSNDALCCFQFTQEMKVGDLVVAKIGRK